MKSTLVIAVTKEVAVDKLLLNFAYKKGFINLAITLVNIRQLFSTSTKLDVINFLPSVGAGIEAVKQLKMEYREEFKLTIDEILNYGVCIS